MVAAILPSPFLNPPWVDLRVAVSLLTILGCVVLGIIEWRRRDRYGIVFALTVGSGAVAFAASGWARYHPDDRPITDLILVYGSCALLTLVCWRLAAILMHRPEDAP